MKYLFCDVETTGTDYNKHGIIQIAGLIDIDGMIVEEFDIRVKPFKGQMISKESMKINGVSIDDLNKFLEPTEGYSKFVEILGHHVSKFDKKDKYFFVGYNSSFDDNFLRTFFKNCGDDYYGSFIWWPTIDIAPFVMELLKEQRHLFPDFKLGTVAKALSIPVDESRLHEAKYDTLLTREIYRKMVLGIE